MAIALHRTGSGCPSYSRRFGRSQLKKSEVTHGPVIEDFCLSPSNFSRTLLPTAAIQARPGPESALQGWLDFDPLYSYPRQTWAGNSLYKGESTRVIMRLMGPA